MGARTKGKKTFKFPLLGIFSAIAAVVFMPTTVLLFFGMLPTVVAAVIDRSGGGIKALTVGAMNIAGCTPFLLELWTRGHSVENALVIISDPRAIIVIYCAAALGYLIDWSVSGIVRTTLLHRSKSRLKSIKERQGDLVERWGPEVTGTLPLDAYGFPLESAVVKSDQAQKSKKPDTDR